MRFKGKSEARSGKWEVKTVRFLPLILCVLFIASCLLPPVCSHAGTIDRVVAFVDDKAITLSEFNEIYEKTMKVKQGIPKSDVLNTIINRILLLKDAEKMKLEGRNDEEILKEYIELKIKAFVRIREEELEAFYKKNKAEFKDRSYEDVSEGIEKYLTEMKINETLRKHIEELKSKAYVKISAEGFDKEGPEQR